MEWAVLQARTQSVGPSETPLHEVQWVKYRPTSGSHILRDHVEAAVNVYFGRDMEDVVVGELSWLTQCHYWLLGTRPGPAAISLLGKFYQDHDMELVVGDEDRANKDYEQATEEGSVAQLRREIARLRQDLNKARAESAQGARAQLKKSQAEVAKLKTELENKKSFLDLRNSELKRLRKEVQESKELKADLCKLANLEKSNSILREENNRLAKLLQAKAKP